MWRVIGGVSPVSLLFGATDPAISRGKRLFKSSTGGHILALSA